MKKTNFLKGLALAAVALVSGFATSCSEEELKLNGGSVNTETITLPAPTASVSVTVVDLEARKIVGNVTTIDATDYIGETMSVECPANEGYTTANAVEVAIPSLSNGQAVNIPVTFYVVTLESALESFMNGAEQTVTPVEDAEEEIVELTVTDNVNGWVNGVYTNDTDKALLIADGTAPEFVYSYFEGFEFASEVEDEEESVESKAATTLLDLFKAAKFETAKGSQWFDIDAYSEFTIKKISQEITKAKMKFEKNGESVEFIANVAGKVSFETQAKDITPTHDGNNSHDGHDGHGNSSNAGGGIGGDDAGE